MPREMFISAVLGAALCAGACSGAGEQVSAVAAEGSLTGRVTSQAEGAMEGVLVSAKLEGGTVTVTVVSDSQGRYAFPEGRLKPGNYRLGIRAVGYELEDPGLVRVDSSKTTEVDVKLHQARDLAPQLMNAEWFMSIEGTPEHKTGLEVRLDLLDKDRCSFCHSFWFVTRSAHDAREWVSTVNRMRFHAPDASPITPTDLPYSPRLKDFWGPAIDGVTDKDHPATDGATGNWDEAAVESGVAIPKRFLEQAAYLASINLSTNPEGTWKYPLRTLPRPKGDETKVIITQYDLPRPDTHAHDAAVDPEGMIWYQDSGNNLSGIFIGRLDPRTGQIKEWRVPRLKPYPPFVAGGLDIRIDRDGNPWFALMRQSAIMKFDKRTEEMTVWTPPPPSQPSVRQGLVAMMAISPSSGMVWFASGPKVYGIDPKTKWITTTYEIPPMYGMAPLPNGNLVHFSNRQEPSSVHELDTKTGKITSYPTPSPNSFPRRGNVDPQGRVWFAEYWAGRFAMFDSNTKQIKEWPVPVPYADPYDAVSDNKGAVWSGGQVTDYIFRLNPATGEVTKYLLPTVNTNIRRIDVDSSTTPVSVWVGEDHHGKITRLEVLGAL